MPGNSQSGAINKSLKCLNSSFITLCHSLEFFLRKRKIGNLCKNIHILFTFIMSRKRRQKSSSGEGFKVSRVSSHWLESKNLRMQCTIARSKCEKRSSPPVYRKLMSKNALIGLLQKLTLNGSRMTLSRPFMKSPSMYKRAFLFSGAMILSASSLDGQKSRLTESFRAENPCNLLWRFHTQDVVVSGKIKDAELRNANVNSKKPQGHWNSSLLYCHAMFQVGSRLERGALVVPAYDLD